MIGNSANRGVRLLRRLKPEHIAGVPDTIAIELPADAAEFRVVAPEKMPYESDRSS